MVTRADVEAGKAFVRLFLKNDMSSQLVRALNKASGQLKRFGRDAAQMGLRMAATGAAIAAPLVLGMREFAKFDARLGDISTMLDNPDEFMAGFRQGIQDMAAEFGKTKDELATGLYDILSATIPPELAMQRLAAATKLAAAGNAEVGASVSVLNTLMETYGDAFADASDASDFLFAIVKRGRTNLAELSGSLGDIIATAKAAGMSVEDMGSAVALLTRATGGTDSALTALQAISATFLKPGGAGAALWSKKFGDTMDANTLKTIGMTGVLERLSTLDAGEVAEIFPNLRALRGIFPAISKMEGFSDDLEGMANRAGNVNTAFEKIKGPLFYWQQGLEQGKNIMLEIGDALISVILPYKDSILAAAKATVEWVKQNKNLVVAVSVLSVSLIAIGTALTVFGFAAIGAGSAIGVLSTAFTFLAVHPLMAAVIAFAALYVAMVKFTNYTAKLSDAMATALSKGDEMRAQEQARMRQLADLADKQSLTNQELKTAKTIVAELTDKYGDMGLTINEVTGAIEGMAAAQSRLNDLQREAVRAELKARIAEQQNNIRELAKQAEEDAKFFWPHEYGGETEDLDRQQKRINTEMMKLDALIKRYKAVSGGDLGALTGGIPEPPGSTGIPTTSDFGPGGESEAATEMNKRILDQLHDYRIALIEDEQQQAIAAINKRYDAEKEKANELGADLELVEEARLAAIKGIDIDFAKTRRAALQMIRDETARLEILRDEKGVAEALALLEHEKAIALRDAANDAERKAIAEKYAVEADIAQQRFKERSRAGGTILTATYSAAAARIAGYQPGGGPEKQMADGIGNIDKNTKELLVEVARFVGAMRVA